MTDVYRLFPRFANLFQGLDTAFGTGAGRWMKRPPQAEDWVRHLQGHGAGMGIAPLRPDSTVMFAAIDLDEPDFDAARSMQEYIPGASFIERSRSGNAHVWVFFEEPIEAWIPMGILREATLAAEKEHVEIFPKNHDFARVRLGNYINLPYHGNSRPILSWFEGREERCSLEGFLDWVEKEGKNDPEKWRRRADWLLLNPPGGRERTSEFGQQTTLHICADHILSGDAGTIYEGHQNAVLFMLAKCLTNWKDCDHDEASMLLHSAAEDLFDPRPSRYEVSRILRNAEEKQYTSTGCDDPLVLPFAHPNCPIARSSSHERN